ncbi:shikimate dehydrogenase family protein [Falsiroseomonas sp. HW251]|uniref:shikimate dehydrogenase family protein n=1 Tax=Falsiroseomonas sp. HW251 TaxID=3390998 RepID=UPI003D314634
MTGPRTRLIFLAGDPIGHTKGYAEYADAIAAGGHDAAYLPAHVPAGRLAEFLDGLRHLNNLAGVVCTIPHKQDAARIGRGDEATRRSGSANLLRPDGQGGWEASGVDGAGFLIAARAAGIPLEGRRVQLLGAGGAGRAVAMAIAAETPASLVIHDPDEPRAADLVAAVAAAFPALGVTIGLGPAEVLVNCSAVGMGHDDRMPCDAALIPGFVYDVVNRADTPLLVAARLRGAVCDHGYSMMAAQIPLVLRWMLDPR